MPLWGPSDTRGPAGRGQIRQPFAPHEHEAPFAEGGHEGVVRARDGE